jgi:hypothetical protein
MSVDKTQLAAGITLGILATLAIKNLWGPSNPPALPPSLPQPEDRLARGKSYGLTPDQMDKTDLYGQTGYLPQHRAAILEAFATLPRPSRVEFIKQLYGIKG